MVSIRGDKGSDVHSFNELLKIAPDGNNVFGGNLRGHAALPESLMLMKELNCNYMMLQERFHLLVKLSGSFQFLSH